jgi:cobyrinic acid a,c-diamide synthase
MVTWAECGGLLWLCRSLVDRSVVDRSVVDRSVVDRSVVDRPLVDRPLVDRSLGRQRLCGVIDADATMTGRLTLGYRHARTAVDTPLGPAGTEARGHEFHYSTVEPAGGALHLRSRFADSTAGFATPTMLASYLHLHLASDPRLAEHLVAAATAGARAGAPPAVPPAAGTAATPGATGATG